MATPLLEKVVLQTIRDPSSLLHFYCSFNNFYFFFLVYFQGKGRGKKTRMGASHMGCMLLGKFS